MVSLLSPNDFNEGGPSVIFQFGLLGLGILSCGILTFIGLFLIAREFSMNLSVVGPVVATLVTLLPVIIALVLSVLSTS